MKPLKPSTLIIVGIAYFIWPFDLPTFIDDIIVNALCVSGAFYLNYCANKMCNKVEGSADGYAKCEETEYEENKYEETEYKENKYEETKCENIEYKKNRIEFVDVLVRKGAKFSMSDYYKYEVYRLPISKTPFTVEELDKAIREVRTSIGKFCIEYTNSETCLDLVVKREMGDSEYGFCRELLDEERVPVQICFDCIPGMKGKYYLDNVHYVIYSYYNCSEPPFYYKVESPLLNGRLF